MSSVSSISSSTNYGAYSLFSKLDTSGKGYIEESDLQTALASVSSADSSDTSELFSQLDSDGDGKVTEDEFTTVLSKLAESLESQYNQSRMEGAMPPPPPPVEAEDDTGFTEEELTSQLEEIGSTDSARSSLISSILENFDAADTNEDGTVSNTEAMAYAQSSGTSTAADDASSSATDSASESSESSVSDARVFRQLVELMRSYGNGDADSSFMNAFNSSISTSA
jgi:Ca2+-binding EF-hand superfamily protein